MLNSKLRLNRLIAAIAVAGLTLSLSTACNVRVKDQDGDAKKVDIDTPMGSIHVGDKADLRDTGLDLYPGAHKKEKKGSDSDEASVRISSSLFGVKVVVVNYETDDAPAKVIAFYQEQLKKYGSVLICHTDKHPSDMHFDAHSHDSDESKKPKKLSCSDDDSGKVVELKVGTEANQHIVAVEPQTNGSSFALVYVLAHGDQGKI